MNSYMAHDGDRIDAVVFRAYESLDNFFAVLEANQHLLGKDTLNSGDIVYLPIFETKPKEETKALWS
ncbi:MAG: phage tail protein [Sulfurospirillum sp.]|nr:phage tail protein [Sulfurospirillum sp.]